MAQVAPVPMKLCNKCGREFTTPKCTFCRVLANCTATDSGCLEWNGYRLEGGYGQTSVHRKNWVVSRLIASLVYGEIPEGSEADHKCNNPPCCNPDHLQILTSLKNWEKSGNVCKQNSLKTTCKYGHPFDRVKHDSKGKKRRVCSICWQRVKKAYSDRMSQKKRDAKASEPPKTPAEKPVKPPKINRRFRLTMTIAQEIRDSSLSAVELAKKYGCNRRTIHSVRAGKSWTHRPKNGGQ